MNETSNVEITKDMIERTIEHYKTFTNGETLDWDVIKNKLYVFGSELAILRLSNRLSVGKVQYSENLESWVWSKDWPSNFVYVS